MKTYSTDEVKQLLDYLWAECSKSINEGGSAFFFKNDHLPPRVWLESRAAEIFNYVKGGLGVGN